MTAGVEYMVGVGCKGQSLLVVPIGSLAVLDGCLTTFAFKYPRPSARQDSAYVLWLAVDEHRWRRKLRGFVRHCT